MANENVIRTDLVGRDRSLGKTFKTTGREADTLGKKLDRVADKLGAVGERMTVGVTLPIVAGAALSVNAASDLNEAVNKTDVVFGKSAAGIHKWAKTAADSFGQSTEQAESGASAFGNLYKTMGLSEKAAAAMSLKTMKLASDLASFHNIDPAEAMEKLQSGLVGEAEPMRELGVLLSESAVKAKAFQMGLVKVDKSSADVKLAQAGLVKAQEKYNEVMADDQASAGDREMAKAQLAKAQEKLGKAVGGATKELTEQQKVQARYALIMEQTKDAQGDFTRTSDGLANSTRRVKAMAQDVAASLGTQLLPIVRDDIIPVVRGAVKWFGDLTDEQKSLLIKTAAVAAAAGPLMKMTSLLIKGGRAAGGMAKTVGTLAGKIGGASDAANTASSAKNLSYFSSDKFKDKSSTVGGLSKKFGGLTKNLLAVTPAAYLAAAALGTFEIAKVDEKSTTHNFYGGGKGGKSRGFSEHTQKITLKADSTDFNTKSKYIKTTLTQIDKMVPKPKIKVTGSGGRTVEKEASSARKALVDAIQRSIGVPVTIGFNFTGGGKTGAGISSLTGSLNGARAAALGHSLIGSPYRIGGTDPSTGVDCSGFVKYVFNRSGRPGFPTYTGNQWPLGKRVVGGLRPGDLIFFKTGIQQWTDQFGWGHVGISEGGDRYVHASGHRTGVIESSLSSTSYPWAAKRYFAKGGHVRARPGGVPAILAEAGEDEVVLTKLRQADPSLSGAVFSIDIHDCTFASGAEAIEEMEREAIRIARGS